jgi:hypothetical protein
MCGGWACWAAGRKQDSWDGDDMEWRLQIEMAMEVGIALVLEMMRHVTYRAGLMGQRGAKQLHQEISQCSRVGPFGRPFGLFFVFKATTSYKTNTGKIEMETPSLLMSTHN